jgi:shikimate dehydrogenase
VNLTGNAKLAGVKGLPVAHSLSPRPYNHWLEKSRIDGAFVSQGLAGRWV